MEERQEAGGEETVRFITTTAPLVPQRAIHIVIIDGRNFPLRSARSFMMEKITGVIMSSALPLPVAACRAPRADTRP